MDKVDTLSYTYYGVEAEFLAQIYMEQIYLRTGVAYFLKDSSTSWMGAGTGVGGGATSVDAMFFFAKQKSGKLKPCLYAFGGFYFWKMEDFSNYGVKLGAGFSYPMGKKGPKFFVEGGVAPDIYSAPDPIGSTTTMTLFGRGGARFSILR